MSGKQTVDLSTVRSAADSVFDGHVLGFKDPGNPLFRTVCVRRKSREPLTQGVIAENGQVPGAKVSASHKGNVQPFETGSIRHKFKDDDVSCRACVLSLFGARVTGYSRMEKQRFSEKTKLKIATTVPGIRSWWMCLMSRQREKKLHETTHAAETKTTWAN